jgi:hypothetical protein
MGLLLSRDFSNGRESLINLGENHSFIDQKKKKKKKKNGKKSWGETIV